MDPILFSMPKLLAALIVRHSSALLLFNFVASLENPFNNNDPNLASDKISNLLLLADPSVPNERFIFFEFSKADNLEYQNLI